LVPLWARASIVLALIGGFVAFQMLRTLPAVATVLVAPNSITTPGVAPTIPWPARGSAALAVSGIGVVGKSGDAGPAPIASMAKVMTALVILTDKPLKLHEPGPAITITAADIADYLRKHGAGESTVRVAAGEQLTEYQALQGLLIPSGNNIADLLAKWDLGTIDVFVARMNDTAKTLGLSATRFADTSGVNPLTQSTPTDLIRLGQAAMRDPVFAENVTIPQAELPVAGVVYNVDARVGQDGLIGIKTGSSNAAKSCFLFAATHKVGNSSVLIYGAIMGQDTLDDAFRLTFALLDAARPGIQVLHILSRGQKVARYETGWGSGADVDAAGDIDVLTYSGRAVSLTIQVRPAQTEPVPGPEAGEVKAVVGEETIRVGLHQATGLAPPSWTWRLTRVY